MKTASRLTCILALMLISGCGSGVPIEEVIANPIAHKGKTLTAKDVRIRISGDSGKKLSVLGTVFGGQQGIPSYTTIPATTANGKSFVLVVNLRNEGLSQKVSKLSTGKEEIVTITYTTKDSDVIPEGDLMLVDIKK
jgi:hypothetical protein